MDSENNNLNEHVNCNGCDTCDTCDEQTEDHPNTDPLQKIADLENEAQILKDTLLRKMAESENLRKRLEKEKEEAIKYASVRFAKDLLAILDNFDKVGENLQIITEKTKNDETLKAFFDGVMLCGRELVSVFGRHGISKVNVSVGDVFNPAYHQAMCELESEKHAPGTVMQIFQSGYVHHDRLLRPAMVSVSKKHE